MRTRSTSAVSESEFPVSVIMAREEVEVGMWSTPRWTVVGVVAGLQTPGEEEANGRVIHSQDGRVEYLWSGFVVRLFKDATESYWYNLVGKQPSLFVVCREDVADGSLIPFVVSANYDEAGAYMETDGAVYSTPMPPEVYRWLEEYVVANFRPVERKARKRENWFAENEHDRTPHPPSDKLH